MTDQELNDQITLDDVTDCLNGSYNLKIEEHFVRWAAARIANDYLRDHPECPRTVEQLIAYSLRDQAFMAAARAKYQRETLKPGSQTPQ